VAHSALRSGGEIARAKDVASMGTMSVARGAPLALGMSLATCSTCRPNSPRHPRLSLPNGGGRAERVKLTAVWIVRVIIGDIDGASVELAFGCYIRNATCDL